MPFLSVVGSFALGVAAVCVIGLVVVWVLAKFMGMPDE